MIQRDIEYGGNSGGYTGGYYTREEEPKEPKKPKKSNKWIEVWFLVIVMILAATITFNSDTSFFGYCIGGAIMLPLLIWYFDNKN